MRLRNLIRDLLFTNIKFEVDEDSGNKCTYVVFKIFHFLSTGLKNHKNIWFFSNTGPDSLKNHKAQHSMLGHHRP